MKNGKQGTHVALPGENKCSGKGISRLPIFPRQPPLELTVNPNLLRFRRVLPTHTKIFTLLPKGHTQQ